MLGGRDSIDQEEPTQQLAAIASSVHANVMQIAQLTSRERNAQLAAFEG